MTSSFLKNCLQQLVKVCLKNLVGTHLDRLSSAKPFAALMEGVLRELQKETGALDDDRSVIYITTLHMHCLPDFDNNSIIAMTTCASSA